MVEFYGENRGIKPRWTMIGVKDEKSSLKDLLVLRLNSGEDLAAGVG